MGPKWLVCGQTHPEPLCHTFSAASYCVSSSHHSAVGCSPLSSPHHPECPVSKPLKQLKLRLSNQAGERGPWLTTGRGRGRRCPVGLLCVSVRSFHWKHLQGQKLLMHANTLDLNLNESKLTYFDKRQIYLRVKADIFTNAAYTWISYCEIAALLEQLSGQERYCTLLIQDFLL